MHEEVNECAVTSERIIVTSKVGQGQSHPRRSTRKRDKWNPHIAQISVMPFFRKKSVPARAMDFCISRVIRPLPYQVMLH